MDSKGGKKTDKKFHNPPKVAASGATNTSKTSKSEQKGKSHYKKAAVEQVEQATVSISNEVPNNEDEITKSAAILIQKQIRGTLERKKVNALKTQAMESKNKENEAAQLIQKRARGILARKIANEKLVSKKKEIDSAKLIQKIARGKIARKVVEAKKTEVKPLVSENVPNESSANTKQAPSTNTVSKPSNNYSNSIISSTDVQSVSTETPSKIKKKRPLYMRIIDSYNKKANAAEEEKVK